MLRGVRAVHAGRCTIWGVALEIEWPHLPSHLTKSQRNRRKRFPLGPHGAFVGGRKGSPGPLWAFLWSRDDHLDAEEELCNRGVEWWNARGAANVSWARFDVPLTSWPQKDLHIHTIEYTCGAPDPDAPPLVCMHGYGFGAALFYATLPALAEKWRGRVLAIDTIGCSLSTRAKWPLPYGHRCRVSLAEQYFVDAIEAWREELKLETMVLLGHSIGGYIALAYAERHPIRLDRLILASPAGVPNPPQGLAEVQALAPWPMRLARRLFLKSGWSPFLLFKDFGRGRKLLTGYITNRFEDKLWIPKPELIEYLVGVNN